MLKLTFWSEFIKRWGSIQRIVSNQAETYIIGAERKVLITIPDVTYKEAECIFFLKACRVSYEENKI